MIIDVFADFSCPFCYMGYTNLLTAIKDFDEDFKFRFNSFQLNPAQVTEKKGFYYESTAAKSKISVDEAKQICDNLSERAKNLGLNIDFSNIYDPNTLKAHWALKYAKSKNLEKEFFEAVMKANFEDGKNIDDEDTLIEIGKSIGLDENDMRERYGKGEFQTEVKGNFLKAGNLGINYVPIFIIDEKASVVGVKNPDAFKKAISAVINLIKEREQKQA